MKSFIQYALLGMATAVSVENMAQLSAEAGQYTRSIKAGEPIFVRCPYTTYRRKRLHINANVAIDGVQIASDANVTTDDVDFFFVFEGMGISNNGIVASLMRVNGKTNIRYAD